MYGCMYVGLCRAYMYVYVCNGMYVCVYVYMYICMYEEVKKKYVYLT